MNPPIALQDSNATASPSQMPGNNSDAPLISVVIPTCHRNDLLALCLDRLAPGVQTLSPELYEVIVTDDGRQTTAGPMIAEKYPWVKWVVGPKKGPAANRNNGAAYARGNWLAFTDDDCLPDEKWLLAFLSKINSNYLVYEGKTTCRAGLPSPMYHAPINLDGGWLWSCNMVVSSDLFRQMCGFDERFPYPHMEDVDFRERLRAAGNDFIFVSEAVVDHPPRLVPHASKRARDQECEVIFRAKKDMRQPGLLSVVFHQARNRQRHICNFPISMDTMTATGSAIKELLMIAVKYNGWVRKYARTELSATTDLVTGEFTKSPDNASVPVR
jgi:glycosyltransferase involved in cell wall biosynthesis